MLTADLFEGFGLLLKVVGGVVGDVVAGLGVVLVLGVVLLQQLEGQFLFGVNSTVEKGLGLYWFEVLFTLLGFLFLCVFVWFVFEGLVVFLWLALNRIEDDVLLGWFLFLFLLQVLFWDVWSHLYVSKRFRALLWPPQVFRIFLCLNFRMILFLRGDNLLAFFGLIDIRVEILGLGLDPLRYFSCQKER